MSEKQYNVGELIQHLQAFKEQHGGDTPVAVWLGGPAGAMERLVSLGEGTHLGNRVCVLNHDQQPAFVEPIVKANEAADAAQAAADLLAASNGE